jgi:hypothetical protein
LPRPPSLLREPGHERLVYLGALLRFAVGPPLARIGVGQALGLGALQRRFLDEQALAFIALARPAPFEDDGAERGVLARAAREGGVARREERQVVEIRAREAERAAWLADQADERTATQVFVAFLALSFPVSELPPEVPSSC